MSGGLSTLPDPGVQSQDGFEGVLTTVNGSGATIVESVGTIPAISGAHSLWLDGQQTLTLHLQRAASESKVHFAVRVFGNQQGTLANKTVRVGVIGGSKVIHMTGSNRPTTAWTATGNATYPTASVVQTFDAALDEPGKDVVLSIVNQYCQGPCPPRTGWLIDDLELQ